MIAAAIKSSIAVLDGRMYKADKQVRERKKGTKLVFQHAKGQSKLLKNRLTQKHPSHSA